LGRAGLLSASDVARALSAGLLRKLFVDACRSVSSPRPPLWQKSEACAVVAGLAQSGSLPEFEALADGAVAGWSKDRVCFAETAVRSASAESDWDHQEAMQHKSTGNAHYGAGAFRAALGSYSEGLAALATATDGTGRTTAVRRWSWGLAAILHSNSAQAQLCMGDAAAARRSAVVALKFDPANEKATHRKARAEEELQAKLSTIEQSARENALKDMCGGQ
jgi:hypothetical protein